MLLRNKRRQQMAGDEADPPTRRKTRKGVRMPIVAGIASLNDFTASSGSILCLTAGIPRQATPSLPVHSHIPSLSEAALSANSYTDVRSQDSPRTKPKQSILRQQPQTTIIPARPPKIAHPSFKQRTATPSFGKRQATSLQTPCTISRRDAGTENSINQAQLTSQNEAKRWSKK